MVRVSLSTSYRIVKAFVISLMIHLCLLVFVMVTFTAHQPSHKPRLFFLGSFLRKSDVLRLNSRAEHRPKDIRTGASDLYRTDITQKSHIDSQARKPSFSTHIVGSEKQSLKMAEVQTGTDGTQDKSSLDIGIESTVPKRLPLTLDSP